MAIATAYALNPVLWLRAARVDAGALMAEAKNFPQTVGSEGLGSLRDRERHPQMANLQTARVSRTAADV